MLSTFRAVARRVAVRAARVPFITPVLQRKLPYVFAFSPGIPTIRPLSSVANPRSPISRDLSRTRLQVWDAEVKRQREAALSAPGPATVSVRHDDKPFEVLGTWSPSELVRGSERHPIVAAKINGVLCDLRHPIASLATTSGTPGTPVENLIELISDNTPEGKSVLWHSAAHILGASLEQYYGDDALLCDGPPLSQDTSGGGGFFYELYLKQADARVTEAEYEGVMKHANALMKSKSRFDRLVVDKDVAKAMFAGNPFKLALIDSIPPHDVITVYRCGEFVDLCRGPHVPHTGYIKGFVLTKSSGSHLDAKLGAHGTALGVGPSDKVLLQRAYGMAFASPSELEAWQAAMEEAKARDHRVIGKAQGLFMFHDMSPGSAFMLPHGTRIYNTLVELMRSEYRKRGYQEVMTPLMYRQQLWKTSGHWDNYKENMFVVSQPHEHSDHCEHGGSSDEDEHRFGLKPMNCPGHCLIFASRKVSYRELPLRIADFSSLHRNEASGALGGLTRLRRFQQDDAHIFCTLDQVRTEIGACLDFLEHVYSLFHFKFRYLFSTRPEKYMGELSVWEVAETALRDGLEASGRQCEVQPGEGAFYGPKIDVVVKDAIGREHQCATLQLDFQLPIKFQLEYTDDNNAAQRPVMIHRAILGSVERMLAILIEHTGGRWPFWLSPRQVVVCPVSTAHQDYATSVCKAIQDAGYFADVDGPSKTIAKRVRAAQVAQYNLILVVGDEEVSKGSVTVRCRDDATWDAFSGVVSSVAGAAVKDGHQVALSLDSFLTACKQLKTEFK